MDEARASRGLVLQYLALAQAAVGGGDARQLDPGGVSHQLLIELSTEHGGRPYHLQRFGVEAAQAATDQSADRGRQAQALAQASAGFDLTQCPAAGCAAREQTLGDRRPQVFCDEERVTPGLLLQKAHPLFRWRA